jgi:hypothetical protein
VFVEEEEKQEEGDETSRPQGNRSARLEDGKRLLVNPLYVITWGEENGKRRARGTELVIAGET